MSRNEALYKPPTQETYPDQPRDQRSVSHSSILLFPIGQVGKTLRFACVVVMPCLFVSLQSAVDCAIWKKRSTSKVIAPWNKRLEQSLQFARSKVPYKWKKSRSPSSQENFIYHVTFWPTVRSMKAVLSLRRNTFLLLYIWYSGRESIAIVRKQISS